ncbi:MAG: methylthioribulose 1-phosphate dehydratase [Myxococcales bacterium]|nr:methylthioribulose 1-phosphate dehydratase [Myxococcales bacterium]
MITPSNPRELIVDLCRQFYAQGWVSGTGGGISVKEAGRVYIAPSGVQKERLEVDDLFVLDEAGEVLERPENEAFRPSACTPLFFNAYNLRGAGAVLHTHSIHALLVTLAFQTEFRCTHLEMMKGISGVGYADELVVPIIENTPHECELADSMAEAIRQYPQSHAVLVRRHGVYVWGKDWVQAKTHAECYDYLFQTTLEMLRLGVDPRLVPNTESQAPLTLRVGR